MSSIAKLHLSKPTSTACACVHISSRSSNSCVHHLALHVLVPLGEATCLLGGVPASDLLLMSEGDFAKLLSAAVCRSGPPLDIRFWYGLPLLYIPPELMVRLGCGCGAAACTCPLLSAVSCTLLMLRFSDLTLAPSGAAELASS